MRRAFFLILVLILCLGWIAIGLHIFFDHLPGIEGMLAEDDSKDDVRIAVIMTVTTTVGVAVVALTRALVPKDRERDDDPSR